MSSLQSVRPGVLADRLGERRSPDAPTFWSRRLRLGLRFENSARLRHAAAIRRICTDEGRLEVPTGLRADRRPRTSTTVDTSAGPRPGVGEDQPFVDAREELLVRVRGAHRGPRAACGRADHSADLQQLRPDRVALRPRRLRPASAMRRIAECRTYASDERSGRIWFACIVAALARSANIASPAEPEHRIACPHAGPAGHPRLIVWPRRPGPRLSRGGASASSRRRREARG